MAHELKSLAHPEWPYTGTPHEWRGFVARASDITACAREDLSARTPGGVVLVEYQKLNFGPELS